VSSPVGSSCFGRAASDHRCAGVSAIPDRTYSVVGVGDLLWDLLPDRPRLGGTPFNAVAHLAGLGCRMSCVSAVGRHEFGQRAVTEVAGLGVDTDLIRFNHHPTGVVRMMLDANRVPPYEIVSPAAYRGDRVSGSPRRLHRGRRRHDRARNARPAVPPGSTGRRGGSWTLTPTPCCSTTSPSGPAAGMRVW